MYSETDLSSAVAAGALSSEAADALRRHVAAQQAGPAQDEEHFRLLTGFKDIFVSIAAVILLVAMAWIGQAITPMASGILVAVTAWGLAEYFTKIRRMALPSILLLLAFVAAVVGTGIQFFDTYLPWMVDGGDRQWMIAGAVCGGMGVIAALLHWRRFMVPITVAAAAGVLAVTAIAAILAALGDRLIDNSLVFSLFLVAGVSIFGFAMWWDCSDRDRRTRRSDVAFWLHLLAAPMIAHPLFSLLGVSGDAPITIASALGVVALYVLFAAVALAIDRRALLVSALAYVLFALTQLFREFGAVQLNVALTALVIGSALLLLSAFWQDARRLVLRPLPAGLRAMVPATI